MMSQMRATLLFVGMICGATTVEASVFELRLLHPRNDQLVSKLLSKDIAPKGFVKDGNGYKAAASLQRVATEPGYADYLGKFEAPDPRYEFKLLSTTLGYEPMYVARTPVQSRGEPVDEKVLNDVEIVANEGGYLIRLKCKSNVLDEVARNYKSHGIKNSSDKDREVAFVVDGAVQCVMGVSGLGGSECVMKLPKMLVNAEVERNCAVGTFARIVMGDWMTSEGNLTKAALEWEPNALSMNPLMWKRIEMRNAILKDQKEKAANAASRERAVKIPEAVVEKENSPRSKYKLLHEMELCDCVKGEAYELRGYEICMQQSDDYHAMCVGQRSPNNGVSFKLRTKKEYLFGDKIKDGTIVRYEGVVEEAYGMRERVFRVVSE